MVTSKIYAKKRSEKHKAKGSSRYGGSVPGKVNLPYQIRFCLASQLSPPHGQLSCKGADLPSCSCVLPSSPLGTEAHPSPQGPVQKLKHQKICVCRVPPLLLGSVHCRFPGKSQEKGVKGKEEGR